MGFFVVVATHINTLLFFVKWANPSMRGEGEVEFVSECLLMNRACIIGMHNGLLCNVHAGVCVCVLSRRERG